jgi:hypothetical protein
VLCLWPTIFFANSTPINPNAKPPVMVLLVQNLMNENSCPKSMFGFSKFPIIFEPISAPAVAPINIANDWLSGIFSGDFLSDKSNNALPEKSQQFQTQDVLKLFFQKSEMSQENRLS